MNEPFDLDRQLQAAQARLQGLQDRAIDSQDPLQQEAIAELSTALEELHVTAEELHAQNEELLAARETLEWERQRYQNLFDFAPDAYLVTDGEGIIQAANGTAELLFDLRRDLLTDRPLAKFLIPSDHSLIYTQLDRVAQFARQLQNSTTQSSRNSLSSLGNRVALFLQDREISLQLGQKTFPVSLSLSGEYNIRGEWVLSWVFRDLRDRKRAEAKIQKQATLIDIASDAIFVRDLENRILFWNKGAERLYGWSAAEALGQSELELLRSPPAELEVGLKTALDKGDWLGELSQFTKTGREILVASRWTLVRDESGQSQSFLIVNTNITEKKHLETQFAQIQRLDSLGKLAGGIAHDLNNIFTPILTLACVLRQGQHGLDARGHEELQLIEESAQQGASMVKQILTFTRGDAGERTRVNLVALLPEQIDAIRPSFPPSITLDLNLPEPAGSLGGVWVDPNHLNQILTNLCINARDAMPEGGILSISAENHWVDETIAATNLEAQPGHYVLLTIGDTGTGIDPTVRDRIFEPFFTTKEFGRGTGLGLAIVSGIVKNYGGFIQVFSEVGWGTQVNLFLPIAAAPPAEDSPREDNEAGEQFNGNRERILIVDDNKVVRGVTQALLESYNYDTLVARDGVEAIAIYTQYQEAIALVIVDIMMPEMGGIPLMQTLKTLNPQIEAIAISGLPNNREPALAAGYKFFLTKPYSPENLLSNVCSLLKLTD